ARVQDQRSLARQQSRTTLRECDFSRCGRLAIDLPKMKTNGSLKLAQRLNRGRLVGKPLLPPAVTRCDEIETFGRRRKRLGIVSRKRFRSSEFVALLKEGGQG